jgi:hypothetical protein
VEDMLFYHPSEPVRIALLNLLDALCSFERSTGHENLVIVKDSTGCQYRSLSGAPVPYHTGDHTLLELFDGIMEKKGE